MTVNEATQTDRLPVQKRPGAGLLNRTQSESEHWTVESVVSAIEPRYEEHGKSPISFFHLLERLKTTPRAGWLRFGIRHPESISDHMYRMSILTMMAPQSISDKLNLDRCTKMALVHDMAESLVGDITPVDPVSKEEKSRREATTMDYIGNNLLGNYNRGLNGQQLRSLWQEYEDSETPESLFVHDIDKVELMLQMVEYERQTKCETDLGQFTHVTLKIQSPEAKKWSDHILWERLELWQSYGKVPTWDKDGVVKPAAKPEPW
ncbi:hypothetical protein EJ04DRAFT_495505 [Polyplosphaeria fusca]|uniref:5'-deoxynucleotidase n=1 Tax=Polyplosphaeria fusca TaxID=682080 RepID=A0A9P4QV80_9PLEO|nr:hypothetical protein EJ04DRAFT_495505 [Polyplosphaeria fusca]